MSRLPVAQTQGETRVLRVFSRLNIGGPSIHVILLTAGMRARGYQTRLVVGSEAPHEGNLLGLAQQNGVECQPLSGLGREIHPLSDSRALWGLYRMIRQFKPVIVHTHTAKAGILGRAAAKLAGVPVVVHTFHGHVLRGYFGPALSAFYRRLERRWAKWTDALIAVSEAVRQDLVDLGVAPASQIRVVPLGLDLERLARPLPRGSLRGEAGVSDEVPLVGIVGRLVPIKDVGTLLRAAPLVRAACPTSRFAVVGDGSERALLEREAGRLGLSEFVFFHGWRYDMASVYGDLDLVVNTSLNEGTPVALIEALAAGIPVVATGVGGTPDVLGGGARGTLVPPQDAEALAAAIVDVILRPARARALAQAAQAYVLSKHSVERLVADVDALYRELLDARSVRR